MADKLKAPATPSEARDPTRQAPAKLTQSTITLRFGGAVVGTVVGANAQGLPLVDYPANPCMGHLPARTCVAVGTSDHGKGAVLLFDEGDPHLPVIVGLIQNPVPVVAALAVAPPEVPAMPLAQTSVEVDGKTLEIAAAETLTLRCGEASITLTREGQVVVRGTQIYTRSSGLNRIQGASVRIN